MKRNAFTKIFALVLCLMMVIGCLPISALASDWEGGIDKFIDEVEVFENDAYSWTWNADYTEATASVTVPAYTAYIFNDYTVNQTLVFTANGVAVENVTYGSIMMRMPTTWTITNNTAAAATYELKLVVPVGTWDNPADLEIGANVATTSSDLVYFYSWIAPEDGVLTLSFNSFAAGANADIQGQIGTYEYLSDNADGTMEIDVTAGTEYKFAVVVETADYTASEFSIQAAFEAAIPVASDLVFTQTGLSFQEFIGIQPVMKNSVATSYDEVYIEVVHTAWDKDQGGFVTTTENIYGSTYAKTYYRFTKKIMAWSMSEIVTITLYGRKGDTLYVGQSVTTSVEQLALTKLAEYEGKGNTKACTALASMLTYGAKLQIVQNFNTENLADANLGAYSKYVAETTPTINKTNDLGTATAVKVNVNNVSMQAQVELQVAFKQSTDLTGYELRYTVGGVTYTMPVSEFSELSGYNFAKIAVKASNMREIYTIALYDIATDKPVTAVLNVSVEGYCTKKLTTADAANTALMYALINYGDAIAAL